MRYNVVYLLSRLWALGYTVEFIGESVRMEYCMTRADIQEIYIHADGVITTEASKGLPVELAEIENAVQSFDQGDGDIPPLPIPDAADGSDYARMREDIDMMQ